MISLLLAATLFTQARGLQPGAGIVSGSIRISSGGPASGVRVAAVAIDDPAATNLLSIAETDSAGRYLLSNIPEGRYFIVAGRVLSLTYYPGGSDPASAKEVAVEAAKIVSNVDFVVPPASNRPLQSNPKLAQQSKERIEELLAYVQIGAESNIDRKLKLIQNFQRDYPKSDELPEMFAALMGIYIAKQNTSTAVAFVQKVLLQNVSNVTELIQKSRDYALQSDLPMAIQYGEKAISAVATMKTRHPPAPYDGPAWESWIRAFERSARSNLDWIHILAASQDSLSLSNVH